MLRAIRTLRTDRCDSSLSPGRSNKALFWGVGFMGSGMRIAAAALALLAAARAWAWLDARAHVLPEDVQAVLPAVAAHRLQAADDSGRLEAAEIARRLIEAVAIP